MIMGYETLAAFGKVKGPFGSKVLEGRGGKIFNLKCLVKFLEGEGREGEGSKFFKI